MAPKTNHDGILIAYAIDTKGYRILTDLRLGTIVETMHVTFAERLQDNPDVLLSLPDHNPDEYFAGYPLHDEPFPSQTVAVVTPALRSCHMLIRDSKNPSFLIC